MLSQREKLNAKIQEIIDAQTEPWGIKVVLVELKNIDLPQDMQRAIAAQAEAERERRAKVIAAEGEFQAAQRLAEAAEIMGKSPITLQLRYLQTLAEIATEHNSTIVFPVPIDLFAPFLRLRQMAAATPAPSNPGDAKLDRGSGPDLRRVCTTPDVSRGGSHQFCEPLRDNRF